VEKRCLVPASAFFEFTGKKYPKAKDRFTPNNVPFMAIAGLRREGKAISPLHSPCGRWCRRRTSRHTPIARSPFCGQRTGQIGSISRGRKRIC